MIIKDPDNDFRYPITIFLMRADRPKYWEFHCPYCTAKVCELDGRILHMRDVSNNTSEGSNSALRIRCPGSNLRNQGHCRMWFEIQLLS